jgi:hypothetical protein
VLVANFIVAALGRTQAKLAAAEARLSEAQAAEAAAHADAREARDALAAERQRHGAELAEVRQQREAVEAGARVAAASAAAAAEAAAAAAAREQATSQEQVCVARLPGIASGRLGGSSLMRQASDASSLPKAAQRPSQARRFPSSQHERLGEFHAGIAI